MSYLRARMHVSGQSRQISPSASTAAARARSITPSRGSSFLNGSTPAAFSTALRSLPIPFLKHQSEPFRSRLVANPAQRIASSAEIISSCTHSSEIRQYPLLRRVCTISDRQVPLRVNHFIPQRCAGKTHHTNCVGASASHVIQFAALPPARCNHAPANSAGIILHTRRGGTRTPQMGKTLKRSRGRDGSRYQARPCAPIFSGAQ